MQQVTRIVVGVDGSQGSDSALGWALAEARLREVPVHAVLAWQFQPGWGDTGMGSMFPMGYSPGSGMVPSGLPDPAAAVSDVLDAAIGRATARDADNRREPVALTQEVVEGHAAEVLLDAVTDSDLMVIGSRGHGGFVGALLGSVSQHVVSHARCPVVVVPDRQRRATDEQS